MSQRVIRYRALDASGTLTKGVIEAIDRDAAYSALVSLNLRPIHLVARRTWRERTGKRITQTDIAHMTSQLAVLLEARIPVAEAFRAIAEQEQNARFVDALDQIATEIESGVSITEALRPHSHLFGDVYVETIRAAESSGNMIDVLNQLADMLERQTELTRNVKGALMYPLAVLATLALAIAFLTIFVVPQFASMFEKRGLTLPLPTRVVIGTSEFVQTFWYLLLAAIIAIGLAVRTSWREPTSRRLIDRLLHRIPFVRTILMGMAVSRFANVLGIAIRSGTGLVESLDLAGRATGRPLLEADAMKMKTQVNHGVRMADILASCEYLPPFARRMIASGEQSGELPRMCDVMARNYEREVSYLIKNVGTLIEPVMIIGLATVVLFVALAIFLPMWDMGSLIG